MDRATKIAFLRRKVELLGQISSSDPKEGFIQKLFGKFLEHAERFPRMPERSLQSLDRELERMTTHGMPELDFPEIRKILVAEFGASRLTASPKTVMNRVLKRGRIETEEEYYEIKEIVTHVDNIERLGRGVYARLDKLAEEFSPKAERPTRRTARKKDDRATGRPRDDETPRWPMVPPEGDDHLCPPGTPLDVLEQFIRAKLELLLRNIDADTAASLQTMIEGGITLVKGPTTQPEQKDFGMRYEDHELEAFSGLEITVPVLRRIEEELQDRFGFRRLLLSPRQLGMAAIRKGYEENQWIRLIIERALHNYTAPPIFSPAEARALKKALKPRPAPTS
jgi:hypothetical protein